VLPIIFTALILRLGHATGTARVLIPHVEARGSGLLRHGLNFSTALYILWNELSRNSMHIYINTILKSRTARSTRTLKADGLSVCDHIFETTRLIFTKFLLMLPMAVARSSAGGVVNSDILCTSGFMDDVMFTHKPRLLDVAAQLKRSAHAASLGHGYKLYAVIPLAGQRTHGTTFRALKVTVPGGNNGGGVCGL